MYKPALIVAVLLIALVPAMADPGDALKRAIANCFLVPAGSGGDVRIAFRLDAWGELVLPPVALGEGEADALTDSAVRAIKRCAPYAEALKGVTDFPFDIEILFGAGTATK